MRPKEPLYIYMDESGDLNFSPTGTAYYTFTIFVSLGFPNWVNALDYYRHQLAQSGVTLTRFHATENKQPVRDEVFKILCTNLGKECLECLIVEKAKTVPPYQEPVKFYSKMVGWLLRYRLHNLNPAVVEKVVVITDRLPAGKIQARALEKAIKAELAPVRYWGNIRHEIFHEPSESHGGLQVADYCNWAIYRKWSRGDLRSYELIQPFIRREFDIFQRGKSRFY